RGNPRASSWGSESRTGSPCPVTRRGASGHGRNKFQYSASKLADSRERASFATRSCGRLIEPDSGLVTISTAAGGRPVRTLPIPRRKTSGTHDVAFQTLRGHRYRL